MVFRSISSLAEAYYIVTKARLSEFFSYRTGVLFWLLEIMVQILVFFFMGVAMNALGSEYISRYGGDYFVFILIGVFLNHIIIFPSMELLMHIVNIDVHSGVIEALLTTPINFFSYLLLNTGETYIRLLIDGAIMLGIGFTLANNFILNLNFQTLFLTLVLILLLYLSCFGLGLFGVALTLLFKYPGRSTFLVIASFSQFLCGAFFPIDVLPSWLQLISRTMPSSYAIEGIRELLLTNSSYSINLIYYDISMLGLLALIFLPLGLVSAKKAFRKVRKQGTLGVF